DKSLGVFGMSLQDGGAHFITDTKVTRLTSITISTNGSQTLRAAAIYDGSTLINPTNVNGSTEFTIDLTSNPIIANDGGTSNFELYVTFMQGAFIIDNDQLVFTVKGVTADPIGTLFSEPDGGGAQSIQAPSGAGNENVIIVSGTALNFVQVPSSPIPVDDAFTIEVEAVDGKGSRDLDYVLFVKKSDGSGILTTPSGNSRNTLSGTALWNDLNYDTEESGAPDSGVRFLIDDNSPFGIKTDFLNAKYTFSRFSFSGASGNETEFPPDSQPENVIISNISRGSNITPASKANAFSAKSWPESGLDLDSYYEVTITASDGYNFGLSSIELDHRSTSTGPPDW
ncbi:MAG: hypothetical protein KAQ62_08615, partial [Cyclobacteriaceae bacterium]|nr:hypothetical protein [Cyclobacteriaceae bacterium]